MRDRVAYRHYPALASGDVRPPISVDDQDPRVLESIQVLCRGITAWNAWRKEPAGTFPNLATANLHYADLAGADLTRVSMVIANLPHALLREANLSDCSLRAANLSDADLSNAVLRDAVLQDAYLAGSRLVGADLTMVRADGVDLSRANLKGANLTQADLSGANLYRANLTEANLDGADLSNAELSAACFQGANLTRAKLRRARLIETNLENANLQGCHIYGVSAWNLCLTGARQFDLVITPDGEPTITVDDLDVAQFIYLILNNERIRRVINTLTTKAVLILGKFGSRLATLNALRQGLRERNYVPMLFDFDMPENRDVTETIRFLAGMSRFIVADLTDATSVPKELEAIVPDMAVPIRPIIEGAQRPYSMFSDYWKYEWVVQEPFRYENDRHLLDAIDQDVIAVAETKVSLIAAHRLRRRSSF